MTEDVSLFHHGSRGTCDGCDGPLDDNYAADEDGAFRVCSTCDAKMREDAGSCSEDPNYKCTGWCSECEVNQ